MAWLVLIISGLFETVWATALSKINGPHKLLALTVFLAGNILSMIGLAYSMKSISAGTAYAVWTGIGAFGTIVVGLILGTESFSVVKIILLFCLVSIVAALKFVSK